MPKVLKFCCWVIKCREGHVERVMLQSYPGKPPIIEARQDHATKCPQWPAASATRTYCKKSRYDGSLANHIYDGAPDEIYDLHEALNND